jgi:hypothetical protein
MTNSSPGVAKLKSPRVDIGDRILTVYRGLFHFASSLITGDVFSADSTPNDRQACQSLCYSKGNGLVRFQKRQTAASRRRARRVKPMRKSSFFSVSASRRRYQEFRN